MSNRTVHYSLRIDAELLEKFSYVAEYEAVSYTHLTLPTKA